MSKFALDEKVCTTCGEPTQGCCVGCSTCTGCNLTFCDAHLLACLEHEPWHCEQCCAENAAPLKSAMDWLTA
jgi:hypothetical protein